MSITAFYDPCKIGLFVNGLPIVMAGEETIFRIDEIKDRVRQVRGIGGEYTWVKTNDNDAVITIVLSAGSPSNAYLNAFIEADNLFGSGSFNVTILIPGFNAITANDCRLSRQPDLEFGVAPSEREWKILVPNLANLFLLPDIRAQLAESNVTVSF